MMREAGFYEKLTEGRVRCGLCPHGCILQEGAVGLCRGMQNLGGILYSLTYEQITALHLDPVEKKPLYHYKPGAMVMSMGSFGCNFHCGFCQNHAIALDPHPKTAAMGIEDLARIARETPGNIGMAYTYNEPTVYFDMMLALAKRIKDQQEDNLMITNGFISEAPLRALIPHLDGVNVDIKSFDEAFYKREIRGSLKEVLRTITVLSEAGIHVEITHLLIQGANDDPASFKRMVKWIKALSPDIPLHVSRYFPDYRYTLPATSPARIMAFVREAREDLNYVYPGNLPAEDGNTYCPHCGRLLVERGYTVVNRLKFGCCPHCGQKIPVI